MKILGIQPFLCGYPVYPFPGGKDKRCYREAKATVDNGHELFILPWQNEHIVETTLYSLSENGSYATVLPTVNFPNRAELVASIPRLLTGPNLPRRPVKRIMSLLKELAMSKRVALKRAMEFVKPDLVHLHYTHSSFARVYREMGYTVPLVLTHHSWDIAPNLAEFDAVVCVSETQMEHLYALEPTLTKRLCRVIYTPVDDEYHRSTVPKPTKNILFVATLSSRDFARAKGLDLLLDAYAADPDLNQWPLYVVGDGPPRRQYQIESEQRNINVKFLGRLAAEEIAELMSRCGWFVMPSKREGLGNVYKEALCMGLPIIGFPPSVRDLSQRIGIQVGFPFDASMGDSLELANLIKRAMGEDSEFDAAHRCEMLQRARPCFLLERFTAEIIDFYQTISAFGVKL